MLIDTSERGRSARVFTGHIQLVIEVERDGRFSYTVYRDDKLLQAGMSFIADPEDKGLSRAIFDCLASEQKAA